VRNRLNRGDDRRLNDALHMATVVRTVHGPATRAYAKMRKAEGKTPREFRRSLKRHSPPACTGPSTHSTSRMRDDPERG
jgi:hypothetical protein